MTARLLLAFALLLCGCQNTPWLADQGSWPSDSDPAWGPMQSQDDRLTLRRDTEVEVEEAVGGALEGIVRFYQSTLRKGLQSNCTFHPSCSNYMIESIDAEGPLLGVLLGVDRWMRDHPLHGGAYGTVLQVHYNRNRSGLKLHDPPGFSESGPVRWTPLQDLRPAPPRLRDRAAAVRSRLESASKEERRLFDFASRLLVTEREDLYRAGTEFRRFLSYHPESDLARDARILAAAASLLAERFNEAATLLRSIEDDPLGLLMRAYVRFRRQEFEGCLRDLDLLGRKAPWAPEALSLRLLVQLTTADDLAAADTLEQLRAATPSDRWDRVARRMAERSDLPTRSPTAAGIFSALIPGAGQVYAGRPADGIVSFLLTGLFIWASSEAYDEDLDVTGGITGGLALLFYASGITGAAKAADAYTRSAERRWFNRLAHEARGDETHWALDAKDRHAWAPFAPR